MRILTSLFLFISSMNYSTAQSRRSIKEMRISKVEIQQQELKKDKLELTRNSVSEYDKHGNVTLEIEYNSDSTYKTYETYVYDNSNHEIEHVIFDKNGKLSQKIISKYDNLEDKKLEITYNAANEIIERIEYFEDNFGQKTEEKTYNKDAVLIKKTIFVYDKKGTLIERSSYDENNKLIYSKKYIYHYN